MDLTLRFGAVRAKGKAKRRAAKERETREKAKEKAAKEKAAVVSKHGGSSDLSLGAGTTVSQMTVGCMTICAADLPTPPAVHHTSFFLHSLLMMFILFAMSLMNASSLMHMLAKIVYHLGPLFHGYASDLVSLFYRVDFAELVVVYLSLS